MSDDAVCRVCSEDAKYHEFGAECVYADEPSDAEGVERRRRMQDRHGIALDLAWMTAYRFVPTVSESSWRPRVSAALASVGVR